MAFDPNDLDQMETFLRQRRLGGISRAGQTLGATGAVMSGRERGAEAFAARDPYPGLVSQREKAELKASQLADMGRLEKGYYDTSIGVMTNTYNQKMALLQSWLSNDTQRRIQSALVNQRGLQMALGGKQAQAQQLASLSAEGEAFFKSLPRAQGAAAGGEFGSPLDAGWATFLGLGPETGASPAGPAPATAPDKAMAFIQERIPAIEAARANGNSLAMSQAVNDIQMAAAAAGLNAEELFAEGGALAGVQVPVAGDPPVQPASTIFKNAQGFVEAEVGDLMRDIEGYIERADNMGVRGIPGFDEILGGAPVFGEEAAGQPDQGHDLDGDGVPDIYDSFDPEKQLMPGVDIAPESDVLSRYVQYMDAIDALPEHPPAQETKAHILQTPTYLDYKKSRGYEGMSDRLVWNEYKREAKKALRERNKDFRAQRRANIEAGRAAPTAFQKPKERAEPEKTATLLAEHE